MALDGMFLFKLAEQLSAELKNSRVEKIYQPSKEELVFVMRSREGAKKLYMSCKADSARVNISTQSFINPANPPMLCMLLRKKFTSAWLDSITQNGFERIITLNFSALNDFGERVPLKIICEIMGRYSNIIFTDENDIIIDSVKRVGASKSSVREILPGKKYVSPPEQDKLDIFTCSSEVIVNKICEKSNSLLSKAILKTIKGISPLRSTELAFGAFGEDIAVYDALENTEKLKTAINNLKETLTLPANGCILTEGDKQIAFSFADILQFGELCQKEYFSSLSVLLDTYYENRINNIKRTQSGSELLKTVNSNIDKISRKLAVQQKELAESEDNENLRIFGELINANLFSLENNVSKYSLFDYYTSQTVDIPADIRLSPSENAQKYFKEYKKKQNAKVFITEQIQKGQEQLEYLESVLDVLERAETPEEIAAVKRELASQGYIKTKAHSKKEKTPKELKPFEFITSGGFTVLVGRNNLSNDKLTFKIASGNDIWFHTKNIHGSHTVLLCKGREVSESDITEAAGICAYYSKGRDSSTVPVDFTFIKFVKRQQSRIPGRVFYTDYKTVYVTPDKDEVNKLKK